MWGPRLCFLFAFDRVKFRQVEEVTYLSPIVFVTSIYVAILCPFCRPVALVWDCVLSLLFVSVCVKFANGYPVSCPMEIPRRVGSYSKEEVPNASMVMVIQSS